MSDAHAARELVDAARRADRLHALLRGLECAAAASLGGCIVLAAGIASGADVGAPLLAVSIASAAMTFALAWIEHAPRAGTAARRAERAAGLDGALTAVLDRAADPAATRGRAAAGVVALLEARVRASIRPADLARGALPRTPIAIAAPLLGAALVGLALERRAPDAAATADAGGRASASRGDGSRRPRDTSTPATDARDLASLGTTSPEAAADAAEELARAASAIRAANDPATADALEIAARRSEMLARADFDPAAAAALAAELERIARTLPEGHAARASIEKSASELASIAVARAPGSASGTQGSAGAASSAGGSPDGAALANASGDGRMFGPPAGGESDPESGGPPSGTVATGGAGGGVLSARWWPSRYDAVVERYLTP